MEDLQLLHFGPPGQFPGLAGGEVPSLFSPVTVPVQETRFTEEQVRSLGQLDNPARIFLGEAAVGHISDLEAGGQRNLFFQIA